MGLARMGCCPHRRAWHLACHRPGGTTRTTGHRRVLCNRVVPTSPTILICDRHVWFLNIPPCKRLPQPLELGRRLSPSTHCLLCRSGSRRTHRISDGLCRAQRSLRLVVPERPESTVTYRRLKPCLRRHLLLEATPQLSVRAGHSPSRPV